MGSGTDTEEEDDEGGKEEEEGEGRLHNGEALQRRKRGSESKATAGASPAEEITPILES